MDFLGIIGDTFVPSLKCPTKVFSPDDRCHPTGELFQARMAALRYPPNSAGKALRLCVQMPLGLSICTSKLTYSLPRRAPSRFPLSCRSAPEGALGGGQYGGTCARKGTESGPCSGCCHLQSCEHTMSATHTADIPHIFHRMIGSVWLRPCMYTQPKLRATRRS